MPRTLCFLVYPDFVLFDLAGPLEAFNIARILSGGEYRLVVASLGGGPVRSSSGVEVMTERLPDGPLDTLIVPGTLAPLDIPRVGEVVGAIASLAGRAGRRASVCTGAFLLAAAGLLDGRAVTTHWLLAPELQARFPALRVEGDRIFIRDGDIWTSAGMSAGIDLALSLIEADLGPEAARQVARMLVVYYRRPGGQDQFSSLLDLDPASDRIRRVLGFAREHLAADLSVPRLAEVAGLSPRQFGRAFAAATGTTPAKAVERLRVEAARPLVEEGRRSFDEIARLVGFADPDRLCQSFIRCLGRTPQDVRRQARGAC